MHARGGVRGRCFRRPWYGQSRAAFHPDVLLLPLEPEDERVDPIPRSQLVGAAYPWINYWRRPILKFMTAT